MLNPGGSAEATLLEPVRPSNNRLLFVSAILLILMIGPVLAWPALRALILDSNYLPHRYCYLAQPGLVWTHVIADMLIGLAYVAISFTLAYMVYKGRRDIPFHWMFLAFGLFIVACGGTHFVETLTVWVPVYVFSAAVKIFTALASISTAAILPFTVPRVLSLVKRAKDSEEVTAKLRRSEERLRAVTETAKDAIIAADSQGRIIYFNPAAELAFGYSSAESTGQPITFLMPERFHSAHQKGLARFLATGEPHVIGKTVELEGKRKNGSEFPLTLSLTTWDSEGKTFFTGILRDISERKKAEEEIRLQNVQLQATNTELEAFSYSVSHDLRAPLRSIDGFSQSLLEDYDDKLDASGRDYLNRIRIATQRMAALIDDLLNLSRITRSELKRETVDLSAVALSIAAELQKTDDKRQVEFHIQDGITAVGDPHLFRVLLQNLLDNSWKFTSKHSAARIEFGCKSLGNGPTYFVRDDGAGFDPRYSSRLFGAFQRLHGMTEFPGTGIGLATVQRIVHRHGGRVWAEGTVEQGATFYFAF